MSKIDKRKWILHVLNTCYLNDNSEVPCSDLLQLCLEQSEFLFKYGPFDLIQTDRDVPALRAILVILISRLNFIQIWPSSRPIFFVNNLKRLQNLNRLCEFLCPSDGLDATMNKTSSKARLTETPPFFSAPYLTTVTSFYSPSFSLSTNWPSFSKTISCCREVLQLKLSVFTNY